MTIGMQSLCLIRMVINTLKYTVQPDAASES